LTVDCAGFVVETWCNNAWHKASTADWRGSTLYSLEYSFIEYSFIEYSFIEYSFIEYSLVH